MNNLFNRISFKWPAFLTFITILIVGFFVMTGYSAEAQSNSTYSVSTNQSSYTTNQAVEVSWNANNRTTGSDWIGIFKAGASNRDYESWKYLPNSDDSGVLTFSIDEPGAYEVRVFQSNGYNSVASDTFTVTGGSDDDDDDGGGDDDDNSGPQCTVSNLNNVTNYPPRNGPIVAFGDSLTAGVGASAGQDYVSELERAHDINIINAGVSGDTTRDALDRLEEDVLSRDPSVVIVWLGGNDILGQYYRRVRDGIENATLLEYLDLLILRLGGSIPSSNIDEDETFENLELIVDRIHAEGAVVILVGFSGGDVAAGLEGRFQAVANETGALFVTNALGGVIGRSSLMSDLVHPNNAGYEIVAERVAGVLACTIPE